MPEGPSIVILKEAVEPFKGKTVIGVSGNRKIDLQRISGKKVLDFLSFGKQFLIRFDGFAIRIHLLLFGTYLINEQKETAPRLSLVFKNGELNFYGCSVLFVEEELDAVYDWSADIMSDAWDPKAAKMKLKNRPSMMVCDALLSQDIFAGVGNIIKNEVLYRVKVHPETVVGNLPEGKLDDMVREARIYSFEFLEWKKRYELKKHWLAHTKKTCIRCDLPLTKMYLGKTNRRSFFCNNCQINYSGFQED
ncbi:MAG: DNA-formamidopyrimidine glycosylase family protein [Anditalea sp.]